MREIKFRAWDKQTNQMLYHKLGENHWYTADNKAVIFEYDDHHETALKTRLSEPMQFTGLRDKNGKETYEGDIVSWIRLGHEAPQIGAVQYEAAMFVIATNRYTWRSSWLSQRELVALYGVPSEVIGNIYEHGDLLETH